MAGDILGAAGSQVEGRAQEAAANYNASIKRQQADSVLQQTAEDERRFRIGTRKQIGENITAVGASGVTMEGSALEVLQESASNAELDALTVRHKGQLQAWQLRAGAAADVMEGQLAKIRGDFGTAAGLLSAATKGFSMGKGGR